MNVLNNIHFVLVRTFHPGNIGSSARAMKNMGLSQLHLVQPKDFPSEASIQMAAGANDLVENCTLHESIKTAVSSSTIVAATTARTRGYDLPELSPEECADLVYQNAVSGEQSCILFGPERMGLHNKDLEHAKFRITIDANPNYSSLNLSAAVQLISYEIYKRHVKSQPCAVIEQQLDPATLPTADEVDRFYSHLESTLKQIEFLRPHQGETMDRLRHLFDRAVIQKPELQILRGILSSIERHTTR